MNLVQDSLTITFLNKTKKWWQVLNQWECLWVVHKAEEDLFEKEESHKMMTKWKEQKQVELSWVIFLMNRRMQLRNFLKILWVIIFRGIKRASLHPTMASKERQKMKLPREFLETQLLFLMTSFLVNQENNQQKIKMMI